MKRNRERIKDMAIGALATALTLGTILPSSAATMKEIKEEYGNDASISSTAPACWAARCRSRGIPIRPCSHAS